MPTTQDLPLIGGPASFEGAVSLEADARGVKPWRVPFDQLSLFDPPLLARAEQPSGVRLTFLSDTRSVALEVEPAGDALAAVPWTFDLLVDGEPAGRVTQPAGESGVAFPPLPEGRQPRALRRVEVYLPSAYLPLRLRRLTIDAGARAEPWRDPRPRWVVYGSSITQAKEAAGPSETWPAIVARGLDLHLTNLGYGGQEHLEPMMGRVIRDLPADLLGLCVGGNVWGTATLAERTFRAAAIGLVLTIRDKHPRTPLAVASFIHCPRSEGERNALGASLDDYRRWTADAVRVLRERGDDRLIYVHGPDLFGPAYTDRMPDGVHPDEEGQRLLGRRYLDTVIPVLHGIDPAPRP